MEQDVHNSHVLLTQALVPYVNGMRRFIAEDLQKALGEQWWPAGVLGVFDEERKRRLEGEVQRHPGRALELSLDVAHFPHIIDANLGSAFPHTFMNRFDAFGRMRRIVHIRNQWAHQHEIAFPAALIAAGYMKDVLLELNQPEAVRIDRLIKDYAIEPMTIAEEEALYTIEPPIDIDELDLGEPRERVSTSTRLWRELRSYLPVETRVEMPEDADDGEAKVTIRVYNTAPSNGGEPEIHFRNVSITVDGVDAQGPTGHFFDVGPGQEYVAVYTFPPRQAIGLSLNVSGEVDAERFFQFRTAADVSTEVIAGIRQEFNEWLSALELEAFVNGIGESVAGFHKDIPWSELQSRRISLRQRVDELKNKQEDLEKLYDHFQLRDGSPLADRIMGLTNDLSELAIRIERLDGAMGATDLEQIESAVAGVREVQLSILRVEAAVRG